MALTVLFILHVLCGDGAGFEVAWCVGLVAAVLHSVASDDPIQRQTLPDCQELQRQHAETLEDQRKESEQAGEKGGSHFESVKVSGSHISDQ